MKKLDEYYERGDYGHRLVKRNDKVAIYSTFLLSDKYRNSRKGYEIFVIRRRQISGDLKDSEAIEIVPSDCMWGSRAFSSKSRKGAENRFKDLTEIMKKDNPVFDVPTKLVFVGI